MSAHQLDLLDKYLKKKCFNKEQYPKANHEREHQFYCAKSRWMNETMCQLPTTKQAHHCQQIPTTINARIERPGCRSKNFHQVGPQGWIPFLMDQGMRRIENGFSFTLTALRVQSTAIRTGQYSSNFQNNDEYDTEGFSRSRGSSLFG